MIARLIALTAVGAAIVVAAPAEAAPTAPAGAAPTAPGAATTVFTVRDPRLAELSGIARGVVSPGVYYVQNDSGDSARFFALDAHSGRVLAEYHVPGAANHDWEDLAVAPDASGVASVWLADIGDNDAERSEVEIYRVDEPRVDRTRSGVVAQTGAPDVWRLRYPAGAANAESLAVAPSGRAYVVTKSDDGHSAVYAVPPRAEQRVQTMSRIGTITFSPHASLIPPSLQVLATGASLSVDGTLLAVRTYSDAYLWRVHGGDVAAALRTRPTRIALPLQPQGEGVCLVANRLVIDSEQAGSAVLSVPLPHRTRPVARSPSRSPAASRTPAEAPASAARSQPAALHSRSGPMALGWRIVIALGAIALVVVVWRERRRRRKRE